MKLCNRCVKLTICAEAYCDFKFEVAAKALKEHLTIVPSPSAAAAIESTSSSLISMLVSISRWLISLTSCSSALFTYQKDGNNISTWLEAGMDKKQPVHHKLLQHRSRLNHSLKRDKKYFSPILSFFKIKKLHQLVASHTLYHSKTRKSFVGNKF